MQKAIRNVMLVCFVVWLVGCAPGAGQVPSQQRPSESSPAATSTQVEATARPAATSSAATPISRESSAPVFETEAYQQLPEIVVSVESALVASPSHPTSYLPSEPIPAGQRVRVLGADKNAAWLLVLHGDTLGWIPSFYSGTSVGTLKPAVVVAPVPSECARFLDIVLRPEQEWVSTAGGSIVVQGMLYRPQPEAEEGEAALTLKIEGAGEVSESQVDHESLVSSGEVVRFTFMAEGIERGDRIRFQSASFDREPLSFLATFFSNECPGDLAALGIGLEDRLSAGEANADSNQPTQPPSESEFTPTPTPTPVVIEVKRGPTKSTAIHSPTGEPVSTILPSQTPQPTPLLLTQPQMGELHVVGQPWEQEGVELNMVRLDVRAESHGESAAARAWFRFFNKTGQKLLVEIDWNDIRIEDSLGNEYVDWEGGGTTSVWVESGESFDFNRYYTRRPEERSRVPSGAEFVQVVVDKFSRIRGARWQFDINPTLTPMHTPAPEMVKGVGETWEQDGLALTLKNLDIRAESHGESAAARAWFALVNHTSERILVEVDFGHIYLVDSFGRRFNDWDGGGIVTLWLDPGQDFEFNRYYSEMSGQRSRVTRGADFALINIAKLGPVKDVHWKFDIVR